MTDVLQDVKSRAVGVVVEAVFNHDDVVEIAVHVFGLVCFDAHVGLLAEPLPLAGERVVAIGGAVVVRGIHGRSRRWTCVCRGHDVGLAAGPGRAVSRAVGHAVYVYVRYLEQTAAVYVGVRRDVWRFEVNRAVQAASA